jgi:hypothetical protein
VCLYKSIFEAVENNDFSVLEGFLMAGGNLNCRDGEGRTLLHIAASRGLEEMADLLTMRGARLNTRDQLGWTPLHLAVCHDYKKMVDFFIARGAEVNARDRRGFTPLHLATSPEVAEILVRRQADLNVRNVFGLTPLEFLSRFGSQEIARVLVENGSAA